MKTFLKVSSFGLLLHLLLFPVNHKDVNAATNKGYLQLDKGISAQEKVKCQRK